ncbi:MAG: DUF3575 domain-containing protein [Tidjanibacter sp.]|nr:DUF3575 domain-containing protein [Tidjanibacter sp.]
MMSAQGKKIVLLIATLLCSVSLWAQQKEPHRLAVTLYFRHDKWVLDSSYLTNSQSISTLNKFFDAQGVRVDSVVIVAHASPEGTVSYNDRLSQKRAGTTKYWLLKNYKSLSLEQIRTNARGEDYAGLIQMIEADRKVPHKKEVLKVLRKEGVHPDKKMRQLMRLRGGRPYSYVRRNILPYLRTAATCILYWSEDNLALPFPAFDTPLPLMRLAAPKSTSIGLDGEPAGVWTQSTIQGLQHPTKPQHTTPATKTILALKTNALYDLGSVVNFAVEAPIGDRFSLVYNHICPWWLSEDNRYCLQLLSIGGEARWWFAPKPVAARENFVARDRLVGHFVGAYAMSGMFDFQARTWGCYQGEFWSAGLTYGYSTPIGKRMNLEFSLSVGYAQIPYRHYVPTDDWQDLIRDKFNSGRLHWFGPTKAEVSLVVPITIGTKGGRK